MTKKPDLQRTWQGLFDTTFPDRGIPIEYVEPVREWSESTVYKLHTRCSSGSVQFYVKRLSSPSCIEANIYALAATDPEFPAPPAFVVTAETDDIRGTWIVTESARGARLAESGPGEWERCADLLSRFHERGIASGWTKKVSNLGNLMEPFDLARKTMEMTTARITTGTYTSVDTSLLHRVSTHLYSKWAAIARSISHMPHTLIHGDCHSGNIFLTSHGMVFVDWDSAAIAPGLLDLVGLIDVAHRMKENACHETTLRDRYRYGLSPRTRAGYGSFDESWSSLCILRALLELEWFARTGDDYGRRAQRELHNIHTALRSARG